MPSLRRVIALLCLSCSWVYAAEAKIKTECFVANCKDGQTVVCVTYDLATGDVRTLMGTRCDDMHWVIDHCVTGPDAGIVHGASDHLIRGMNWWIRFNVNAEGALTEMWGLSSDGEKWRLAVDENVKLLR